jgi:hypothetical protein
MPVYDDAARRDAATFARRYFAKTITLDTFLRMFADSDDPLIRALEDALINEPRRGGMMGLRDRWWQAQYWQPVERLLSELERGSAGEVPSERVYPKITLWGLVLGAALLLWVGLLAAQNLSELLKDLLYRGGLSSLWSALWRSMFVGTLAILTAAGLDGWIHHLYLYRTRKFHVGD